MATATVGNPRPGSDVKKGDLLKPGATVTVVGLTPGAGGSMAVVRWTNPPVKSKLLQPANMEVVLLEELACSDSPGRELDVQAARAQIQAALPLPATDDAPIYLYIKDSEAGAAMHFGGSEGDSHIVDIVQRSHARLREAIEGLPVTHSGAVVSSAMARSVGINAKTRKTSVVLQAAQAAFPQAQDRLKVVKHHAPLADALLVVAHVVGIAVKRADVATTTAAAAGEAQEAASPAAAPAARPAPPKASPAAAAPAGLQVPIGLMPPLDAHLAALAAAGWAPQPVLPTAPVAAAQPAASPTQPAKAPTQPAAAPSLTTPDQQVPGTKRRAGQAADAPAPRRAPRRRAAAAAANLTREFAAQEWEESDD